MAARKSERILNLLVLLLTSRRFLTRAEIREMVEGYRNIDNDKNFERQFERDKEELIRLGYAIVTEPTDNWSEIQDGYRILSHEVELPEVVFNADEQRALALASLVWQSSLGSEATSKGLQRLRSAGLEIDLETLPAIRPAIPVKEPVFNTVYQAQLSRQEITFWYHGKKRHVQPWRLRCRSGFWVLRGYDLALGEERSFKLVRFESDPVVVGKPGAFDIPEVSGRTKTEEDYFTAIVALKPASTLRSEVRPTQWEGQVPDGFEAFELRNFSLAALVSEICSDGPNVVCLGPEEVRSAVRQELSSLVGGR